MRNKVPETVSTCFQLIESDMIDGPWVMGEHFGISDMYLFTLASWLKADSVDLSRLPRVMDHSKRVAARPAVEAALAEHFAGT